MPFPNMNFLAPYINIIDKLIKEFIIEDEIIVDLKIK